ncbi:hypothetical protein KAI54_00375 [Candidatus Gracilibacteria bacterium]|nr:hypothetical protein [Candidatus Gracilibacteria bacterium]
MKTSEKSLAGWYFLGGMIVIYFVLAFFKLEAVIDALFFVGRIFKTVLPVLLLIFALLIFFNASVSHEQISNFIGKSSGGKKWVVAVMAGILSAGPIYLWYPLLRDLHKKGVSHGFIVTFLYNRAIKLPLLPLLIFYFDWKYALTLLLVMVVFSLVQGVIFERIKF